MILFLFHRAGWRLTKKGECSRRRTPRGRINSFHVERQEMGPVLNLTLKRLSGSASWPRSSLCAAGTIDYPGGWLYLGVMVALSVVFGTIMVRVDPGLLERTPEAARAKGPAARGQVDSHPNPAPHVWRNGFHGGGCGALALVSNAIFRAVRRMWSPPGGAFVHLLDHAHQQFRSAGRENTKETAGRRSSRQALMPLSAIRCISGRSSTSRVPRSCLDHGGGL